MKLSDQDISRVCYSEFIDHLELNHDNNLRRLFNCRGKSLLIAEYICKEISEEFDYDVLVDYINSLYEYANIIKEISSHGKPTVFYKHSLTNIDSLERYYKSLAYPSREDTYYKYDSADLEYARSNFYKRSHEVAGE